MNFFLDTDIFTLAYYDNANVRKRIAQHSSYVAITVVTRFEVLWGRITSILKSSDSIQLKQAWDNLQRSETYLTTFPIEPFNDAAIAISQHFENDKVIRKIGRADLLIACITLAHNATLVTRNVKDFAKIPNLKIENWAK